MRRPQFDGRKKNIQHFTPVENKETSVALYAHLLAIQLLHLVDNIKTHNNNHNNKNYTTFFLIILDSSASQRSITFSAVLKQKTRFNQTSVQMSLIRKHFVRTAAKLDQLSLSLSLSGGLTGVLFKLNPVLEKKPPCWLPFFFFPFYFYFFLTPVVSVAAEKCMRN